MGDNSVGANARAKLDRAKFHLEQLRRQVNSSEYQAGQVGYRIDYESQEVVVLTQPDTVSLGWAILAGEIVHQSRSALEHIVWELIEANGGTPKQGVTGFPVFWEKTKYRSKFKGMIDGINAQAFAIIDGLQPLRPDYTSDPLYVLNEMWNRDKHRLLNIAVYAIHALSIWFGLPDGTRSLIIEIPQGPLPEDTEITRRGLPFHLPREAKVVGEAVVTHNFVGGPADGKPFVEVLSQLVEFAESVVSKLVGTAV
jgi:hypothetical protein